MMTTRRSLFVVGALLAVGVLLAPQAAFAQQLAITNTPTNVTAVALNDTQVRVSWGEPAANNSLVRSYDVGYILDEDATVAPDWSTTPGNQVEIRSTGGGQMNVLADGAAQSYVVSGLTASTAYDFAVRAVNADGTIITNWEETDAGVMTLAPAPADPVPDAPVISAMPAFGWSISVSWDAVPSADEYRVEWRKETESYGASDRMVEVTGTSYSIANADADTVYMVRVSAANMGSYGDASDQVTVRMPTLITEKPTVTISPGNAELKVEWTAVTGGTGYCVEWGTGDRIVPTGNTFCTGRGTHRTSGERTHTITTYDGAALKNGTEYVVQVTGSNAGGPGPVSDRVKGTPTTVGTTAPGAPSISLTSGDSMLMVSWDAVDGATKYKVQWRTSAQTFGAADQTAEVMEGMSYDIMELENGMEYMVRVAAGNKDHGYGEWSGEAKAMPMMPTPALPVFGALALGAGLVAAGRRRLRARRQPRLLKA